MTLPVNEKREPQVVVQTPYNDGGAGAALSPDGRWLAYASDQTGQQEIWLRPFVEPGAPSRVSPNGGLEPVWSRDGRELYYREGTRLMAVAVDATTALSFKTPTPLFESRYRHPALLPTYDVTPDGRFVMIKAAESQPTTAQIVIVSNWLEELKRLVPAN